MMLYNQTGSTVWLFKGHPIAAWGGSDVPKWLAESPGVLALVAAGTLGPTLSDDRPWHPFVPLSAAEELPAPPAEIVVEFPVEAPVPPKKLGKKAF